MTFLNEMKKKPLSFASLSFGVEFRAQPEKNIKNCVMNWVLWCLGIISKN